MKVDIIMPAHNPSGHIVEAIKSCLSQSYRDIKITVIDDGSTKNWDNIKKLFPMVNFITTPKNLGPAGARNYGIKQTSGELISFLDSDDIMHQDKILNSVAEFKKSSNIGMTCGNYRIIVNGRLRNPFYSKSIHIDYSKMMRQNLVASGSATVKRSVLNEIGLFNEEYWIAEDMDLWLRISEKYPIKYIHKVLYFYRIVPGGNSLTQRQDIQAKHLENLEKIKKDSRERVGERSN